MTFDIRTLAIAKTGVIPVRNAAGEKQFDEAGNPLTITVHSPGTKKFNQASHDMRTANSDRMVSKMQGKSDGKQSADDELTESAEFLAAITISFDNFSYGDATGYAQFEACYADIEIGHIADDVRKFINDRANFMRPEMRA